MSRYIDADKLLNPDNIIVMQDETGIDEFPYTYTNAVKVKTILNAPTADVEEVRHGHWEEENRLRRSAKFLCSVCGGLAYFVQPTRDETWKKCCPYKYCPNCGAKMDGERREENEG